MKDSDDLSAGLFGIELEMAESELGELMSLAAELDLAPEVTAKLFALVERPCHDTWMPAQAILVGRMTVLWSALNSYGGYQHRDGPSYASGTRHPEWPDQMCPTGKQVLRALRRLAKRRRT